MSHPIGRPGRPWMMVLAGCAALSGPASAQNETLLADLVAGTAVPHTMRLGDLTPEWRRLSLNGDWSLGLGGMQSMLQSLGAVLGYGSADLVYTRGASVRIGDQQFLVGYRLPSAGLDFGTLIATAMEAIGGGGGAPSKPPEPKPVTRDSELSLVLVNLRSIAAIQDIRPFDMAEATRPPSGNLMEAIMKEAQKEKAAPAAKPPPARPPTRPKAKPVRGR